jgi:hypothetical protein
MLLLGWVLNTLYIVMGLVALWHRDWAQATFWLVILHLKEWRDKGAKSGDMV